MHDPRPAARGQSLVEFALLLPLLFTLFGAIVDMSRLYSSWITLEGATRDAAEYAATNATTSTEATTAALTVVCGQTRGLPGYRPDPGNPSGCLAPAVSVTSFSHSTSVPGATTANPIATVTVSASVQFQAVLPLPLFTRNGSWTLSSVRTYSIAQGR